MQIDPAHPLRIVSRASPLAMAQALEAQARLAERFGVAGADLDAALPILALTSSGDRHAGELAEAGGKGLFCKEVQEALLSGRADLAVHSLKDLPTDPVPGLVLAATLERASRRDVLVGPLGTPFAALSDLPDGARIATASPRRRAFVLHQARGFRPILIRGNVGTRLARLDEGRADVLILAEAGMTRLGLAERISGVLGADTLAAAAGQGALGLEAREDDERALAAARAVGSPADWLAVTAERAALEALGGSCRTAIGVEATWDASRNALQVRIDAFTPDGRKRWRREAEAAMSAITDEEGARGLGQRLGRELRAEAGDELELEP